MWKNFFAKRGSNAESISRNHVLNMQQNMMNNLSVVLRDEVSQASNPNPLALARQGDGVVHADSHERTCGLEHEFPVKVGPDEFEPVLDGFHKVGVATPNDPKLSDGGGWRAGCTVGARRRPEAASVTAGAVRCSAWLGDVRFMLLCGLESYSRSE